MIAFKRAAPQARRYAQSINVSPARASSPARLGSAAGLVALQLNITVDRM
ncbi:hypothetical protein BLL52_0384 [Rhodoferax antarcticus ANT.BR]|uniref:Uncharacterized protein n=1 Tax=Rhodoferax antarcticus ANT.BR TaxID=1111071 RepID=A0A1Q8YJ84_9BURK|nr:hypothetical protein BLL52_0384 [Rhodoferax antarcticus ANT.BR]